jgi:hypothetical protein
LSRVLEGVVLGAKKKDKLTKKQHGALLEEVTQDLEVYDLVEWQKACRGFGPVHLEQQTRKEWFDSSKRRLPAAKEIVGFIESWKSKYKNDERFNGVQVSAIVKGLIEAVRKSQKKKGMQLGLLNVVKLAGFRTLVKWADDPSEIGKKRAPRGKWKPKNQTFERPDVDFVRNAEIEDEDRLLLTIAVINKGRIPYQNVEFELDLGKYLNVLSVEQFTWSPLHNSIRIGFIGASIGTGSKECLLKVHLAMTRKRPRYKIGAKIIYDDYERGKRAEIQLDPVIIEV